MGRWCLLAAGTESKLVRQRSAAQQVGREALREQEIVRLQKQLAAKSAILQILEESLDSDLRRGGGGEGGGGEGAKDVGMEMSGRDDIDAKVQKEREALERERQEMARERAKDREERKREAEQWQREREERERERESEYGERARERKEMQEEVARLKSRLADAEVVAKESVEALRCE